MQKASDLDLKSEQADVDDITDQRKLRIADVLSAMNVDDVRKLVEEIEQRLRRSETREG